MLENYLKAVTLVEKIHRLSLSDLKFDLNKNGVRDINNVQSFIIYKIGDKRMSIGDLTNQECYLGSNVSYNLRKLVENGYVLQEPNEYDRRASNVSLTKKGTKFYEDLTQIFENKALNFEVNFDDDMFTQLNDLLVGFEKVLSYNQFR